MRSHWSDLLDGNRGVVADAVDCGAHHPVGALPDHLQVVVAPRYLYYKEEHATRKNKTLREPRPDPVLFLYDMTRARSSVISGGHERAAYHYYVNGTPINQRTLIDADTIAQRPFGRRQGE